eukprot:13268302-Alexandrium_andersonii.AAC.1
MPSARLIQRTIKPMCESDAKHACGRGAGAAPCRIRLGQAARALQHPEERATAGKLQQQVHVFGVLRREPGDRRIGRR